MIPLPNLPSARILADGYALEREKPAYEGEAAYVASSNTWYVGISGEWVPGTRAAGVGLADAPIQVTAPELPEFADLPREVVELVYSVERYMTSADARDPRRQIVLWNEMGRALNAVWGRKDRDEG